MVTHTKMQEYVDQINSKFPAHALWNGYKIRMFKRKNLVIGGSQDWIYYHNIDVIFKKVIFFNLPDGWHDTAIETDDLFRLTTHEEFKKHHPSFDLKDRHIFAFDLSFDINNKYEKHTYFVVAANVFFDMLKEDSKDLAFDGSVYYEDPLGEDVHILCKDNRVI